MSMHQKSHSSLPHRLKIWMDGKVASDDEARVSVLDRGFLYGDSIFETLRTYGGQPFALDAHLERLKSSAERVYIELPISLEQLREEVIGAVAESGFEECYLRLMVTRGLGALGLDPRQAVSPLRVLIVAPLNPPPLEDYQKGISAVTFETSRPGDHTQAAGAKVGNYLVAVLAQKKAAEFGAKEALIVSPQGEVVEGATSNLFWFEADELWTVPVDAGILAGITREHILQAAKQLGISVKMRVPLLDELLAAQAVFISSSIREMLSIVQIDDRAIADGHVQSRVQSLHAEFRRSVGVAPVL